MSKQKEWKRAAKMLFVVLVIFGSILAAAQVNGTRLQLLNQEAVAAQRAQATNLLREVFHSNKSAQPADDVDVEPAIVQARNELVERRKDMCIGAMILGEAGGEPLIGKYMTGYVGHMRAVDRWFNSDNPCVQVCKKGKGTHREFDGTKEFCAQIETAFKKGGRLPTVPEEYMKIAREVRTGVFQPTEECRNVRYFANFAESSPGGIKYFQKNTKIRCVYENHLFAESRPKVIKAFAKVRHHKNAKPVAVAGKPSSPKNKKLAAK